MLHQQLAACKRQRSMAIMPAIFFETPSDFSKRNCRPYSLYAKWMLDYV
jgi:hypothetical protein